MAIKSIIFLSVLLSFCARAQNDCYMLINRIFARLLHSSLNLVIENRRVIDKSEVVLVEQIAVKAFKDDPLFNAMVRDEGLRDRLVKTLVRIAWYQGTILVNKVGSIKAFALWHSLSSSEASLLNTFRSGQIEHIFRLPISKVFNLLKMEKLMKRLRVANSSEDCLYLNLVGVDPDHQGEGLARSLIQPVIDHAEKYDTTVVLETQKEANRQMYEYFGFKIVWDETFLVLVLEGKQWFLPLDTEF
jgi:GNAT superfamily N-acetyltransferase